MSHPANRRSPGARKYAASGQWRAGTLGCVDPNPSGLCRRADHVKHTIGPALLAGKWVISDRFTDRPMPIRAGKGPGRETIRRIDAGGGAGMIFIPILPCARY